MRIIQNSSIHFAGIDEPSDEDEEEDTEEYDESPTESRRSKKNKKDKKHKKQKKSKKRKKKRHKSLSSIESISENENSLLGADDESGDAIKIDSEDRTYTPELNNFAPVSPGEPDSSLNLLATKFLTTLFFSSHTANHSKKLSTKSLAVSHKPASNASAPHACSSHNEQETRLHCVAAHSSIGGV